MAVVVNYVERGHYLDSVALMRLSRSASGLPGVESAAVMIGSRTNKDLMRDSGLLTQTGEQAQANDLIVGIRALDDPGAQAALDEVRKLLSSTSRAHAGRGVPRVKGLASAVEALPDANLALISVPGEFAAGEARKALNRGLHVLMFSDNVPLDEERALKDLARERGLLMMGPDCGTCLLHGVPIAFANAVPRGDIGIVSASGTGLQEVSTLIARAGRGISHGIGVGGRDLYDKIGAITTLMAIDALENDPETARIVLVSKPPSPGVTEKVVSRIARSRKRFSVCLMGCRELDLPPNARLATTLRAAAEDALGVRLAPAFLDGVSPGVERGRRWVRGLYCGGTLCAEAQFVLLSAGHAVYSNVPIPGAQPSGRETIAGHSLIDLGDDEYTRGRPHPMIDPQIRSELLTRTLADAQVAVILLDVVIGFGAHSDPAGVIAEALAAVKGPRPLVVAAVCGTEADPQGYSRQVRALQEAGVVVAPSNAHAAELAAKVLALPG